MFLNSEERYQKILATAMDGFWMLSLSGQILAVNSAYCKMSGYSEKELLSLSIQDVDAGEDEEAAKQHVLRVMSQGADRFEAIHRRKDGSLFFVEVSTSFYQSESEGSFLFAFLRDITDRKNLEKTLSSERERLNNIIEGTRVGTWEWNIQTGETIFNDFWAEMLGYSLEELGKTSIETWTSLTHPADLPKAEAAIADHFEKKRNFYECELRMRHKDGHWIWVLDRGKVFSWDGSGKPTQMAGTHQEVTSRKNLETQLLKNQKFLEESQHVASVGSWELDLKSDHLIWSDETYRIFGLSPQEFPATYEAFLDAVHPDDRAIVACAYASSIQENKDTYEIEHRIIKKNSGEVRFVQEKCEHIRDSDGSIVRSLGTVQDITERKGIELRQRSEHQRLMTLFDGIDEAIYVIDPSNLIIYANDSFRKQWGSDIVGKKCHGLIFDRSEPCSFCPLPNADADNSFSVVWEMQTRYGRWYRISSRTIRWTNNESVRFQLAIDITARKEAEERIEKAKNELQEANNALARSLEEATSLKQKADAANRAKSDFLANMSHEFRTPMNSIIGFADILSQSIENEKQRKQASLISQAGRNLVLLVNDILDLSKIEAGRLNLSPVPFSLHKTMQEATAIFKQKAEEKKLRLELLCDTSVPQTILLDKTRLRQILINLLGNAIKFTESGFVRIQAFASLLPGNNACNLKIQVSDSGIGIPDSAKELIFGVFEQAPGQDHGKYGGTGLGLSISRRLTEMMGGSISLDNNTETTGAVFTLRFPAVPIPDSTSENSTPSHPSFRFSPHSKILIVDNAPSCRALLRDILEPLGAKIFEATDGSEALETATKEHPDIVLTDIQMQGTDGPQLLLALRANPDFRTTPVIAISASTGDSFRQRASKHFDAFLEKPVSADSLLATLARFLPHTLSHQPTPAKPSSPSLPPPPTENLSALRKFFPQNLESQITSLNKLLRIKDAKALCETVAAAAEKSGSPFLKKLSEELSDATSSFQITKLRQSLSRLADLLPPP